MSLALCTCCHVDNHRHCVAKKKASTSLHRFCLYFCIPFHLLTIFLRECVLIVSGIILIFFFASCWYTSKVFISDTGDVLTGISWYFLPLPVAGRSRYHYPEIEYCGFSHDMIWTWEVWRMVLHNRKSLIYVWWSERVARMEWIRNTYRILRGLT